MTRHRSIRRTCTRLGAALAIGAFVAIGPLGGSPAGAVPALAGNPRCEVLPPATSETEQPAKVPVSIVISSDVAEPVIEDARTLAKDAGLDAKLWFVGKGDAPDDFDEISDPADLKEELDKERGDTLPGQVVWVAQGVQTEFGTEFAPNEYVVRALPSASSFVIEDLRTDYANGLTRAFANPTADDPWSAKHDLTVGGDPGNVKVDLADRPDGWKAPISALRLTVEGETVDCTSTNGSLFLPLAVALSGSDGAAFDGATLTATGGANGTSSIATGDGALEGKGTELPDETSSSNPDTGTPPPSTSPQPAVPGAVCEKTGIVRSDGTCFNPKPKTVVGPTKTETSSIGMVIAGVVGLLLGAGAGFVLARSRKGGGGMALAPVAGIVPAADPSHPFSGGPGAVPAVAPVPVAGAVPVVAAVGEGRRSHAPAIAPVTELREPAPGWTAAIPGGSAVRMADLGLYRLLPRELPEGRVWSDQTTDLVAAAGWLEKKVGRGEDAEPTVRIHDSGRGILGVYDGTGGAGAGVARVLRDGTELSGAYVASRLVRDLVELWFAGVVEHHEPASDAAGLTEWLQGGLKDEAEFLPPTRVTMRGSLSRSLPTTAAAVAFELGGPAGQPVTTVDVLWAGDSRVFLLTPRGGLQVLSVDDTRETDALRLIRNDQPMENLVSADRPFRINHGRTEVAGPAVLLVATDGCFGYLKTPAHFEYLLLDRLRTSGSVEEWAAGVTSTLAGFTADDASFALAAIGFRDHQSLLGAFGQRLEFLAREHWDPFTAAEGQPEAIEDLRERSWLSYRDLYQARAVRPFAPAPEVPGGEPPMADPPPA